MTTSNSWYDVENNFNPHTDDRVKLTHVLVLEEGHGDYYEDRHAALYRSGSLVWEGYSNDSVEEILAAVGVVPRDPREAVQRQVPHSYRRIKWGLQ